MHILIDKIVGYVHLTWGMFGIPLVLLFCVACANNQREADDFVVAKVLDSELRFSQVRSFIPQGTSADDSLLMAKNYIRNWITKQLLLSKALQNLDAEDKNMNALVEDYKTSLLIHQYKQKLVSQKLKADIRDEEIEQYYEKNKYNFILPTAIVRAVFFIIPESAPKMSELRRWFAANDAQSLDNLEQYCISNAKKFDNFDNQWQELGFILNLIPSEFKVSTRELMRTKRVELGDNENYYFLKLVEFAEEQTVAPLEYVKDEIELILKNKVKMEFEVELERQINQEGVQKNYVTIY
ncbi:hypothetical protein FACS1894199_01140 [Bacteroidia bacterium]|nr:hypothetical protein FACS1894199_01140 [Bacteroidia bacterium]